MEENSVCNPEEEFKELAFNPDINFADFFNGDSLWLFSILIFMLLFAWQPAIDWDDFYRTLDELTEKEKPKEDRPD